MTRKTLFILAVATLLLAPLSACNTVEGLGKDVRSAGEAMTGAAKSTRNY